MRGQGCSSLRLPRFYDPFKITSVLLFVAPEARKLTSVNMRLNAIPCKGAQRGRRNCVHFDALAFEAFAAGIGSLCWPSWQPQFGNLALGYGHPLEVDLGLGREFSKAGFRRPRDV